MANLLYVVIERDKILDFRIKSNLYRSGFSDPDDHAFLMIGNHEDDNSIILDPWIKLINIPDEYYNNSGHICLNTLQKIGFIGTKSQYLSFIKFYEREDGFLQKCCHRIISYPIAPKEISVANILTSTY